jgi:hypothetical protein
MSSVFKSRSERFIYKNNSNYVPGPGTYEAKIEKEAKKNNILLNQSRHNNSLFL